MAIQRWEYAEFGYAGHGEHDLRQVWFSHRETWTNRPSDPNETLRQLGDLGFELVNLLRYPKAFGAQLFYRQSRFTMRMNATSTFYMFKRPREDEVEHQAEREVENPADRPASVDRPSDY
jgi:hypothetical protein